jgi:HSP20 family protein
MANRSMQTWDPFREMVTLRDAMDSLFENALIQPSGGSRGTAGQYLPVDLMEKGDNFVVRVSLPGINPDDLNVTVVENVLTIQGEVRSDEQEKDTRYHVRERRWGAFSRQIALPTSVDANAVQADYNNGVLTLTLPKSEEAKPKRIQIQANGHKVIEGQAQQR